jgi:hypothetical protein
MFRWRLLCILNPCSDKVCAATRSFGCWLRKPRHATTISCLHSVLRNVMGTSCIKSHSTPGVSSYRLIETTPPVCNHTRRVLRCTMSKFFFPGMCMSHIVRSLRTDCVLRSRGIMLEHEDHQARSNMIALGITEMAMTTPGIPFLITGQYLIRTCIDATPSFVRDVLIIAHPP